MNKNPANSYSSIKSDNDDDFDFMCDSPKEDPAMTRRRIRDNELTKKLGAYLLKGYCMLGDACPDCHCILLRTPERQLLCVGCSEVDKDHKKSENGETPTTDNKPTMDNKKDGTECLKKPKSKKGCHDNLYNCPQLESKLKWAVDELTKSHNPTRISEMCTVIIKLTETIKALKAHESTSVQHEE